MTKALIRSLNRRGSQSDKTPPVARKQKFSDPSNCDCCGAVYTGKPDGVAFGGPSRCWIKLAKSRLFRSIWSRW
jgi:hypothetical protein